MGWQKLLEELDNDNDGKISLLEFEALRTSDIYRRVFRKIDVWDLYDVQNGSKRTQAFLPIVCNLQILQNVLPFSLDGR